MNWKSAVLALQTIALPESLLPYTAQCQTLAAQQRLSPSGRSQLWMRSQASFAQPLKTYAHISSAAKWAMVVRHPWLLAMQRQQIHLLYHTHERKMSEFLIW